MPMSAVIARKRRTFTSLLKIRIWLEPPRIVHDQRDGYAHQQKVEDDQPDKNQPLVRMPQRGFVDGLVRLAQLIRAAAIDFCLEAFTQSLARLFSSVECRRFPWLPLFPAKEL